MSTPAEAVHLFEDEPSTLTWASPGAPEEPPPAAVLERRCEKRYPVTAVVELIPLTEDSDCCAGPTMQVECRDISRSGIRIRLSGPLPYRTVGLALPLGDSPEAVWVTRMKWCRYTADGFYESGGNFLRVINRCEIQSLAERAVLQPADGSGAAARDGEPAA